MVKIIKEVIVPAIIKSLAFPYEHGTYICKYLDKGVRIQEDVIAHIIQYHINVRLGEATELIANGLYARAAGKVISSMGYLVKIYIMIYKEINKQSCESI